MGGPDLVFEISDRLSLTLRADGSAVISPGAPGGDALEITAEDLAALGRLLAAIREMARASPGE